MQFNDNRFAANYTACSGYSLYHDLNCGHRVQAANLSESCGMNCKEGGSAHPFVCPDCIVGDVRLEMTFESIDLSDNGNDVSMADGGVSREDKIRAIAQAIIMQKLAMCWRPCKVMPKFQDPKLQFFNQFLLEEGYEGISADVEEAPAAPPRVYKRPGGARRALPPRANKTVTQTTKAGEMIWEPREIVEAEQEGWAEFTLTDLEQDWQLYLTRFAHEQLNPQIMYSDAIGNLTEVMADSRLGTEIEDDAMKAVRSALEACTI